MRHSLYVHIPFCAHRCAYCDFNTYAGQEGSIPAYVDALQKEVRRVGRETPREVSLHTIYFGGGTPSLLSARQLGAVLDAIRAAFRVTEDAEITLEANPGTVALPQLASLRALGVNRISLGVQSANGFELKMLERQHTFLDVLQAATEARKAGFENLNMDLIYGLPEQTLTSWQTTVKRLLELQPEHISAYALTLEHGTPFGRWHARGLLADPSPDIAADMYEWLSQELEAAGYGQYEISNWARLGRACLHNLQYWRALPYLGLGAGAHGYAGGYRYSNALGISTYIERLAGADGVAGNAGSPNRPSGAGRDSWSSQYPFSPAMVNHHRQTALDNMSEYMITGLRLTRDGVSASAFRQRFGVELTDQYPLELEELTRFGLLEWVDPPGAVGRAQPAASGTGVIHLTRRGRLLGNQVFMRFVA